jgi:hypothetical protein
MARKAALNGLDLNGQKISNMASGSAATDAVTLGQIQNLLAGLSWHGAVRAASTANITISSPGASIDSVAMAAGNRVLLKNQTTASENGVWVWNGAAVAMTRPTDGQQGNLNAGAAFYVDEGSTNADTAWTLATDDPITVGTTALTFNKFGGGGSAYTAGSGIDTTALGTGSIVVNSTIPRRVATNVGDGSSTSITVAHALGTLDVMAQLILVATGETVDTDTVRTNANNVQFTFPSAPAANAYRAVFVG